MAGDTSVSDPVNPLSRLTGPSLFLRTFRAPVPDASSTSDRKTLESIHDLVKSMKEMRSPEKLISEAKTIVDDGEELLDCSLLSIAEKLGKPPIAAKAKDKRQERRPGLGRDRKKGPFSLRPSVSQPPAILRQTMDINKLKDPDAFFDAFEVMENANDEIDRQMGVNMDLNAGNPPTRTRIRRPGIEGRSHKIKLHHYQVKLSDDVEVQDFSQETQDQGVPSVCEDESEDIPVNVDHDLDVSEVKMASSTKKVKSNSKKLMDELFSRDSKDLEEDSVLNFLHEHLNIGQINIGSRNIPERHAIGRTSILSPGDNLRNSHRRSAVVNSMLQNMKNKSPVEQVQRHANPILSPNLSSPLVGSLSLLKKKILKPNPLKDPFSPMDADFPESGSASPVELIDILHEHYDNEEAETAEPTVLNTDMQKMVESESSHSDQLVHENANIETSSTDNEPNERSADNEPNEASADNEPNETNYDNVPSEANAANEPNEVQNNADEETLNLEDLNDCESDGSVHQDNPSSKQPFVAEPQPKGIPKRKRREVGVDRIRKAHPMRKSIADRGTSFGTGVRRSKRVKTRPLEFWKGERLVYGRLDDSDSMKLLGVKILEDSIGHLKVNPFIPEDEPEYKKALEFAARH